MKKENQPEQEERVVEPSPEVDAAESEVTEEAVSGPTPEEQLKACEDRYLRVHADFENIKKRMEREKLQAVDFANESFARDLLAVMDTLEMALKTDDPNQFEQFKEGVKLTRDNLSKVFEKHGIKPVTHEEGFDPHYHEAVMQAASEEHAENDIVQVLQQGFVYKDRVLRPSMVSICKK